MGPITLSAAELAAVTGGRLLSGSPEQRVERMAIDSRTMAPGDLFIAIRGERFDGHEFVASALAAGAAGVMVAEAPAAPEAGKGRPAPIVLQVEDTTRALQDVAREIRRRAGATVVAITGSAGKTTTKELAAEFLSAKYRVFRNKGNLNNHVGLPLSLLELRARPDVAVVELGMNHSGEIRTLVGIAEPDVRVWTNVGDAHAGFFASAEAIADAKAEILEHARPADVLIVNADDPRVAMRAAAFPGRTITFGFGDGANVRATGIERRGLDGIAASVVTPHGGIHLSTPLLGLANLANVLAAVAVATELGVPLPLIAERASTLKPAARRGELVRLPGGVTLIDDSYNSSPAALRQALEIVRTARGSARKVAVLGEMLELGDCAQRLHQECGRAAAEAGLDLLITVGHAAAGSMADAARAAGMPEATVVHVQSSDEAADLALATIRPGDLVLVKGSRGIRTDVVIDRLKVEFA